MTSARRTQRRLAEALPELLARSEPQRRGRHPRSLRELAAMIGVNQSYLSRIMGAKGGRPVSKAIAAQIAEALGLPHDYFAEYRAAAVAEVARTDPSVIDELYDELKRRRRLPPPPPSRERAK